MVIETGSLSVDHERHEPAWPLIYRQARTAFHQAVSRRGRCDGVALHDARLCAVCSAWLRVRVGSPVATVVVAIVVRLDVRGVPESRVELTHLILALLALLIGNRCAERVVRRPFSEGTIARWVVEVFRQPLEYCVPQLCAERRKCVLNELNVGTNGHRLDQAPRQRPGSSQVLDCRRCKRELMWDSTFPRLIVTNQSDSDFAESKTIEPGARLRRRAFCFGNRPEETIRLSSVGDDPDRVWTAGKHIDLNPQHDPLP
jgi:hypothetical protein